MLFYFVQSFVQSFVRPEFLVVYCVQSVVVSCKDNNSGQTTVVDETTEK